jgi:hypothetical protein
MASDARTAPEPVVLIIADISGYTRYMTANARTLAHSQAIITELMEVIVAGIEPPLELAKLEGDAVFFYSRKAEAAAAGERQRMLGRKLVGFFQAFAARLAELRQSSTCSCAACAHIDGLRLKIVVHSGEALFHRVRHLEELAGVDVIIAHRLLKNSVAADQYLLVTEAARPDLDFPEPLDFVPGQETFESLGAIRTLVHFPRDPAAPTVRADPSFAARFSHSWGLFRKIWFAPLAHRPRMNAAAFRHLEPGSSRLGRAAFALLTALLTPLFLPAGLVVAALHTLKRPPTTP